VRPEPLSSEPAQDALPERLSVYLQPGQIHVAAQPTTITTILASCVAVCLFDPRHRIGGMNHFLLPQIIEGDKAPGRFGPLATRLLIERLRELGSTHQDLKAKVFGGASVLDALVRPGRISIGEENAQCALAVLAAENIPVVASDFGGRRGRKVVFRTEDGTAMIKWF
jgi:chemotaxis protein CheD